MLSTQEANHIVQLINHVSGAAPLAKPALDATLAALRLAVDGHLASRAAMAAGQQSRRDGQIKRPQGRPTTTWFMISMGSLWARPVLGIKAAHIALTNALAQHDGGAPPNAHSLGVMLSRKGEWARLLCTEMGQQMLTVAKCAAPDAETIAALEAQPAEILTEMVRIRDPKKLAGVLVPVGSAAHKAAVKNGTVFAKSKSRAKK